MQEVLENVSKNTGASHKRIAKVLNENLDKFDDGKDIYKFVAHQCKGIENDIGLCWGISLMQFISPLSESLEFDDIREPIIKYCPMRKNTDLVGGGIADQVSFMINVAVDVQTELGENYIKIFKTNAIDYYIKEGIRPGLGANYSGVIELPDASSKLYKKTNFLNFYNFNENFLLFINNNPAHNFLDNIDSYSKRILKKYNVKSMYLVFIGMNGGPGHAMCIRQCNNKLFIFNDDVVTELKNISLFDVMENPNILKLSDDSRLVRDLSMNRGSILYISSVLLKNKNSDTDVPETNQQSPPDNSIELLVDTKNGKRILYFNIKDEENTVVVDLSKLNILSFKNQTIPVSKYSSVINLGYNKFKECDFILPSEYETLNLADNDNLEKLNIKNYYHINSLDLSNCRNLDLSKQEFPPKLRFLSLERNYLTTEDVMKINFPENIRLLNFKLNKLDKLEILVNHLTRKYKDLILIDISDNKIDLLNGEHTALKLDREFTIVYEELFISDEKKSKILENLPANLTIDFEANY